jgi:hypothetical protein
LVMQTEEITLSEVQMRELQQQATDKGMHIDELIRDIVQLFLIRAGDITRFVAKKGPRK